MKQYHVFFWSYNYPRGGMRDYYGSFDTLDDALAIDIGTYVEDEEGREGGEIAQIQEDGSLKIIKSLQGPYHKLGWVDA